MKTIHVFCLLLTFVFFFYIIECTKKVKNLKSKKEFNNKRINIDHHLRRTQAVGRFNTSFVPLKIFIDLTNFNETLPDSWNEEKQTIFIKAINRAKEILEAYLYIEVDYDFKITYEEDYFYTAHDIEFYSEKIPNTTLDDYNFFILFNFVEDTKIASYEIAIEYAFRPIIGVISINEGIQSNHLNLDYLTNLMLHQFIHILGFDYNTIFQLNLTLNQDDTFLKKETFPNLVNYAKKYFDCPTINGIDTEPDEYDYIHWPSRILLGELMTNFDYPEEQVLSGFTLAFLEDLPYLNVTKNYTGGLMRFGKKKGCKFIEKACTDEFDDKKLTFANEFYLTSLQVVPENFEPSCSSGRLSKTVHKIYEDRGYLVGPEKTDFCPISEYNEYNDEDIYIGHCSEEHYDDSIQDFVYEAFESNSFCVLSSLVPAGWQSEIRAVCYEMFCSSKSLTIKINNNYFVCPQSGGRIEAENFEGYILCPDYNLICTTKDLCNSIYDCFNKKSEEKIESFNYEYVIKTTQDSGDYSIDTPIFSYELAEDGKCPFQCSLCDIEGKCSKCVTHFIPNEHNDKKECIEAVANCNQYENDESNICKECKTNYILVKEDDNTFICDSKDNENQYFSTHDEENPTLIYYKRCHNGIGNCYLCESETKCTKCINEEYKLVDEGSICGLLSSQLFCLDTTTQKYKSCSYFMENCNKCQSNNGNFECLQCDTGYALFHDPNESIHCSQITSKDLTKYYTTDEGKNYYPCNNVIQNCDTCENPEKCLSCIGSYILVNDNSFCLSNEDINNGKYYIDHDKNNYYFLCSESLSNCDTCANKNKCNTCKSNYVIEESDICIPYLDVTSQLYYLDSDIGKYASCSKLSNCEKCKSKTECINCITNYATIGEDLSKCEDLSTKKYYYETSLNKYEPCSYKLENCDTCVIDSNNNFYCDKCMTNYALKHDNVNSIVCREKTFFGGNNKYFTNDTGINYYSCSNSLYHNVSNCLECSNKNTCSQCQTGYKLVNQNTKCYLQTDIDNNYIYYNPITQLYSPCSDLISLCKKCNSIENCTECGEEGAMEESNICMAKELDENNSFFEDETTHKYVSCSIIDNCIACTSRTVCSTCKEGFNVKDNICQIQLSNESDNNLKTGEIIGIYFWMFWIFINSRRGSILFAY